MDNVSHESTPTGSELTPVCAIGASAGGIKALQQFFRRDRRPTSGLAYVVIVHLCPGPSTASSAEILAGRTPMPVQQVDDSPS